MTYVSCYYHAFSGKQKVRNPSSNAPTPRRGGRRTAVLTTRDDVSSSMVARKCHVWTKIHLFLLFIRLFVIIRLI